MKWLKNIFGRSEEFAFGQPYDKFVMPESGYLELKPNQEFVVRLKNCDFDVDRCNWNGVAYTVKYDHKTGGYIRRLDEKEQKR